MTELRGYTENSYINGGFQDDSSRHKTANTASVPSDRHVTTDICVTRTKLNVWKNLLAISGGFFFLFTAFQALANLQSSLNSDEGLGVASMSAVYVALVLSSMFVPSITIKKLGCKWTVCVCMLMYSTFIAANFYSSWGTLIPTAIVVGLAAAPLWSAKCTYLTQLGGEYADLVGEASEVIIVRFFGIFFMIFQSAQIAGNLISSLVLHPGGDANHTISQDQLAICGASYCNQNFPFYHNESLKPNITDGSKPAISKLYTLCGIYLALACIAAIVIALVVDPLKRSSICDNERQGGMLRLLIATFRQLRNPKQLLLIPLTIYSGLEQGFIGYDFTKGFVTCSLGVHMVGFVLICFGVFDAICSPLFGMFVKRFGRAPLYAIGALINLLICIIMLTWRPNPDRIGVYFLISGAWGVADAICQTQINAFYGIVFSNSEEAAFSNYRLWESVGFIIASAYSAHLCMNIKIYFLIGFLVVGMTGYGLTEITIYKKSKQDQEKQ